jgi:acetylglutamate kinase
VRGALAALRSGAPEVVIADGRATRALTRALEGGFGTRLRGPLAGDVPGSG